MAVEGGPWPTVYGLNGSASEPNERCGWWDDV